MTHRDTAEQWLTIDPDPTTRAEIRRMLEANDEEALQSCFGSRLQFGTAGLRGALGPGPNRMNRVLVRQVSEGLSQYLLATVPDARERGVVVGRDGRHGSDVFAEDTAAILASHGIPVYYHDEVVPTPVLAHSLVALGCCAGVMVTASHNPPQDNGYKVYWGNGAQIIPPHDSGISDAIDAVETPPTPPTLAEVRARGTLIRSPEPRVSADYFDRLDRLRVHRKTGAIAVYTAMHGVGWKSIETALTRAGHTVVPVLAQRDPDGDFPTVSFPNPEEPGALDLAKETAREVGADLIIANDPDADRLAVAVPDGDGWRQLTGNQVGQLLAEDLLAHGAPASDKLVATTIVSSTMLSRIAEKHGATYLETLTGFKWIANGAIAHEAQGGTFVMGYEEALGYSVGDVVRDKDGVSAALLLMDLASDAKSQGQTLLDKVAALYRTYGLDRSLQKSLKMPGDDGARRIQEILTLLRTQPPQAVGDTKIVARADVLTSEHHDLLTGEVTEITLPKSNVLAFYLADGSRILARPSGTEPKIKFYFELRDTLGATEQLDEAESRTAPKLDALVSTFLAAAGVS